MPLMELEPPTTLPRTHTSEAGRSGCRGCSTGKNQAWSGLLTSFPMPLGMPMRGLLSTPPASRSRTFTPGSAESR